MESVLATQTSLNNIHKIYLKINIVTSCTKEDTHFTKGVFLNYIIYKLIPEWWSSRKNWNGDFYHPRFFPHLPAWVGRSLEITTNATSFISFAIWMAAAGICIRYFVSD
jgi:hypothetical protein